MNLRTSESKIIIIVSLFVILIGLTFLIILGVFWFGILISIFGIMICLFHYVSKKKNLTYRQQLPAVLLFITVFFICVRLFVFELYSIPSGSMEDSILIGDKVIVNKLCYGPRMPSSIHEIPMLNMFWRLSFKRNLKQPQDLSNYIRLKGYSELKRNDVVIFYAPWKKKNMIVFVKRCIGLPGDTVSIINSDIFINNELLPSTPQTKHEYWIYSTSLDSILTCLNSSEIKKWHSQDNKIKVNLTTESYKLLRANKKIDSIAIVNIAYDSLRQNTLKTNTAQMNYCDFGPVVVPCVGYTIKLDSMNVRLYRRQLKIFEKVNVKYSGKKWLVNGIPSTHYTFKSNYYWMMGDNRHYSSDSRKWGFVHEEKIIGKASLIVYSHTKSDFNWKRLFKTIK